MAEFDIKLQRVRALLASEDAYATDLGQMQEEIDSVKNNLSFKLDVGVTIKSQLDRIHTHVGNEKRGMKQLRKGLSDVIDQYDRTETRICDVAKDGKLSLREALQGMWEQYSDLRHSGLIPFIPFPIMPFIAGPCVCFFDLIQKEGWEKEVKGLSEITNPAFNDKMGDKLEEKTGLKEKKKDNYWIKDKNGRLRKLDPKNKDDKKIIDDYNDNKLDKAVTLIDAGVSKEVAAYSKDGEITGDAGSLKGEVSVAKAEGHANAYGGLYSVGPDGEKRLTPGFGAEVGVGFSAFSAEGTAMLGDDNLGIYAEGEIAVGKVEAKAGGDVGFFDKNGKFNPSAYVGASAEAIAIEAAVAGGAKILGSDIKGKVGATFGVGAHANVGFKDGVFKFDVGAACGPGVSANLEIDMSGTIEKAGAAYSKVKSAFSKTADSVGKAASKTMKDVGKATDKVKDSVGKAADKAVDKMKNWFH